MYYEYQTIYESMLHKYLRTEYKRVHENILMTEALINVFLMCSQQRMMQSFFKYQID